MTTIGELEATLTAPGQPFEVVDMTVRGVPTRVWAHAPASLRAVWDASGAYGERDFLVFEDERLTFATAHHQVAALAAHLRDDFGLGPGGRFAIAMLQAWRRETKPIQCAMYILDYR